MKSIRRTGLRFVFGGMVCIPGSFDRTMSSTSKLNSSGFAYGLQVTPFLPQLVSASGGVEISYKTEFFPQSPEDVRVRFETIVESVRQVWIGETEFGTWFRYGAGQEFVWQPDSRTVIDCSPIGMELDLRLATLYGPVLSWVAHSLGFLVLHGSAVKVQDQVFLFLSPRGGGKSTTVAYLHKVGHQPLCDDLCSLRKNDGRWEVAVGPTQFRLWEDSSELFSDTYGLYQGTRKKGKTWEPVDQAWHQVDKIFVLQPEPTEIVRSQALFGAVKIANLLSQSRVSAWLDANEKARLIMDVNELSRDVKVEVLFNRVGLSQIDRIGEFFELA